MTVCAWIAYGMPIELHWALRECFTHIDGKPTIFRHPSYDEEASRDHYSYWIIYRKLSGKYIPKFKRMRGMNLWMRSITGNKFSEWMYYTIYIPGAILGNVWNRLIMWIGKAGPERTNEWWIGYEDKIHNRGTNLQIHFTKWQKFWLYGPRFKLFGKEYHIEILVPAYPLHNKGWQLYVMRKIPKRDTLCKILLKRVEKSNILMRLLLGDTTVTEEEVNSYPPMSGYRPGVYFPTCDRYIVKLTPKLSAWNFYEKDLIIWLYEQT